MKHKKFPSDEEECREINDSGDYFDVKSIYASKAVEKLENKSDPVCKNGSYSLSNCTCLVTHNVTCEYGISLQFGP